MGGRLERWQDNYRQAQGGMTFWPLLATTILYGVTSIGFAREANWPMCAVFAGYAGANLGFLALTWK